MTHAVRPLLARCAACGTLALAALAVACGGYVRPLPDEGTAWRDSESDARRLVQGVDTATVLDSARVAAVAAALRTVRERVPEVRGIAADPHDEAFVVVLTPDSSAAWRARAGADSAGRGLAATGIPAIDSVSERLGGARVDVETLGGGAAFRMNFRRALNATAAADVYSRIAGVRYAGRPPEFGAARPTWTVMIPRGTQTYFVFARACAVGTTCAGTEFYYVTHDALTHTAFLVARELYADVGSTVSLWDVPGRGTASPYDSFDDVLAGVTDARWWRRRHAVEVVEALLDTAAAAYVPPDRRGSAHLAMLRRDALRRRGEALAALATRVTDEDPEVAAPALTALQRLTGQRIGAGADGTAAWLAWLGAHDPAGSRPTTPPRR